MALRKVENRHHRSAANDAQRVQVHRRSSGLLHQMVRGYFPIYYHREEPDEVHLRKHHLQVRDTSLLGFRQYCLVR